MFFTIVFSIWCLVIKQNNPDKLESKRVNFINSRKDEYTKNEI
jgi:hypothetical protein